MKLVTIKGRPFGRGGLLLGSEILDIGGGLSTFGFPRWAPRSAQEVVEAGEEGWRLVDDLLHAFQSATSWALEALRRAKTLMPLSGTALAAPIERPSALLLAGGNYPDYEEAMMDLLYRLCEGGYDEEKRRAVEARSKKPRAVPKNIQAIIGPDDPIILPDRYPDTVDAEAELAIVIGKACFEVDEADADDCIFGFTLINDVSPRAPAGPLQIAARDGLPIDFTEAMLAKGLPTMCPLGPAVASKDEFRDAADISFGLDVSGQALQFARTSSARFSPAAIVSELSRWYSFRPGDVISMGSPGGVGITRDPPLHLRDGDLVRVFAEEIGFLENPVTRAPAPGAAEFAGTPDGRSKPTESSDGLN